MLVARLFCMLRATHPFAVSCRLPCLIHLLLSVRIRRGALFVNILRHEGIARLALSCLLTFLHFARWIDKGKLEWQFSAARMRVYLAGLDNRKKNRGPFGTAPSFSLARFCNWNSGTIDNFGSHRGSNAPRYAMWSQGRLQVLLCTVITNVSSPALL
ncbi:uncharacterized protein F4822DRAFT_308126 [Hypoxylon trugodes]|uniref:uncharacterized protein n=1 Tax=Hypoxylon trugodes TaxID=326681 RepID=UPI0021965C66|nr:uncharacterized protein F4822DRAFT_308126 [Hypoxylon trugodes]KAI1386193.1 hypothetical protein F4822DRAFT_308126 [Hypoxylon trugodes]